MATNSRPSKQPRKGPNEPARRPNPWTNARASPTFPPSPHSNGTRTDPQNTDRVLQSLSGLTGTTVTLVTKTSQRYEGVVASTTPEADTPGVTLKDVKEISTPGAPLKEQHFIPATNIDTWSSGPADAKLPDTFRTDKEISQKKGTRERELQQWSAGPESPGLALDDDTFSSTGNTSWDQFAVNEKLFGVKTNFDENLYTTKLDRSGADYKERERQAQRIANEIINSGTSNPHIAEERNLITDDSGADEEAKYGAVVRGANAYIPPGARGKLGVNAGAVVTEIPKVSVNGPDGASIPAKQSPSKTPSPAPAKPAAADPVIPAFREFVTSERQRLTQKKQALAKSDMEKRMAELVKFSQSFKLNKPIPDDLVPILAKDEEKQRAIREKSTKDATSSQARAIGATTPANATRGTQVAAAKIIPPSASGAADGRRTTMAPAAKAATNSVAPPAQLSASVQKLSATAVGSGKPVNASDTSVKKPAMFIQAIPPFKGKSSRSAVVAPAPAPATNGTASVSAATNGAGANNNGAHAAAAAASGGRDSANSQANNRLNVNASSFKPNARASAFTPGSSSNANNASSPPSQNAKAKADSRDQPPNPFFGTRPIKKSPPVNVKDDFNPFKHNKVTEATQVAAVWPYNGKRYSLLFPPPPHQPQHPQQQHAMPPPGPPPMPPPSYEEVSAGEAAARGYVYAYPPYAYPGQPMMPGTLAPPGPPGAYMQGPYMQHMQYPPGMPPPGAMYSPGMAQMPPYMPPPPGPYPPPNGAGPRPSMPPTPIPAHAHPYYHQSPQLQHAVPYHMMMPPPPTVPQHPYDGGPAPPVQMGGHA